jgi:DNA-binding CsgD family transcriptional regulator
VNRANSKVGESLFTAPKTVAMHPSNAYRKLGVTSRRDLPPALAEPS